MPLNLDRIEKLLGPRPYQYKPEVEAALDRYGIPHMDFMWWMLDSKNVPWGRERMQMYVAVYAAMRAAAMQAASDAIVKARDDDD